MELFHLKLILYKKNLKILFEKKSKSGSENLFEQKSKSGSENLFEQKLKKNYIINII